MVGNAPPITLIESVADAIGGTEPLSAFNFNPVLAMPIWSMIFIAIAVWRFGREEF
jgi:hypothetical protein